MKTKKQIINSLSILTIGIIFALVGLIINRGQNKNNYFLIVGDKIGNNEYVDSLKNNSELFTGFTNNVDNLYFKWYWSYYSENIFFSSNFFINLKIIFERNF